VEYQSRWYLKETTRGGDENNREKQLASFQDQNPSPAHALNFADFENLQASQVQMKPS
jgi:hypothetical protein